MIDRSLAARLPGQEAVYARHEGSLLKRRRYRACEGKASTDTAAQCESVTGVL